MAGDKVRCATCKHQVNAFCILKKCKVALNKRRKCNKYKIEPGKVKLKQQLPTTRGQHPSVIKNLRKEYKKKLKEDAVRRMQVPPKPSYMEGIKSGNSKHPLTGDLSRFTSTAGKE